MNDSTNNSSPPRAVIEESASLRKRDAQTAHLVLDPDDTGVADPDLPHDWRDNGVHWHAYAHRGGASVHDHPDEAALQAGGLTPTLLRTPHQVASWLVEDQAVSMIRWNVERCTWTLPDIGHDDYDEKLQHAGLGITLAAYIALGTPVWFIAFAVTDPCHRPATHD